MRPESTSRTAIPADAPARAWSATIACTAASSWGTGGAGAGALADGPGESVCGRASTANRASAAATARASGRMPCLMASASRSAGARCLALVAVGWVAACREDAGDAGRAKPRPLEILVASDAQTLDPRYATDAVGLRVTRLLHAGLVQLDPETLVPLPYAATSWRWLDPLTLRVELRRDLRFHSGAPLGAADVVATLRALADPGIASRHAHVVDAIADAVEDGPDAVVIHLAHAHATL